MSSVYLEFHLKGGGCAIVDAGMIGAAIARGTDLGAPGTKESPTLVVLRAGEQLEVIGESPAMVIARIVQAKRVFRGMAGAEVHVDWLQPMGDAGAALGELDGAPT